ncbi:MAG: sodium-dependent transporter [Gammaproteobacteria bacterium]|nr:sodium-dependent transporter [Gammaproteobacteria bacterium]
MPSTLADREALSSRFSSFLATVMTLSGVAIGLGNVWRFPYMMGTYGGSAFLLVFILFVIVFGLPIITAELALARSCRGATITVMRRGFGTFGRWLGYVLVLGVTVAASYYILIVANVFYSVWHSISTGFRADDIERYQQNLLDPRVQFPLAVAIVWTALWVIDRGLTGGIERVSNLFVPVFFLTALYLIYAALSQPRAMAHVLLFLQPDFSRIGVQEVFAALGQCFFSLGLGAAYIMVYGRFLRDDTDIIASAGLTAFNDTMASMLASMFIVPSVLAFGLEMSSGPRLLFGTLPELFNAMAGGRLFGSLMLIALSMVAFLSVIASFQVITVSLLEEPLGVRAGRRRLLLAAGLVVSLLILVPAEHPEFIAPMDLVFGSGMTILGGIFAVIAITWRVRREEFRRQLGWQGADNFIRRAMMAWLQWGVPVILAAILGATVYDALFHGN